MLEAAAESKDQGPDPAAAAPAAGKDVREAGAPPAPEGEAWEPETGLRVVWTHGSALFVKRLKYFSRDRKAWCCQILLPVLVLLFGLALLKIAPSFSQPPRQLSLDAFNPKGPEEACGEAARRQE